MVLGRSLCVSMVVAASPALAADDFIDGVYMQSEELCGQARKETLQALVDAGNIVLSVHGLQGVEYSCEFVQVSKATGSPSWAVTAICQEPGYVFPDVLSVTRISPTQLDLVSGRPIDDESEASGNSGSYYLCEGVALP
ncbi:hypothetical protein EN850_20100 [Mesorhizobium sp. M8A.F.Ca.ET.207.01.1.1]|uniref:hypothetical protein n=1 Tax=Mesorhizobium sp. M8A.F.Ca.ET.207.01.1.1 TaxID=2563968 RepID=UPI00109CAA1E|nr:hypothetical protein [Mesorhizobium sp. M8A.F.Ca.ET.207.01.1.1]TGQ79203.1 hypothetical protein EN850_20100 [Mesorhizobium sp. M8A.F.Ca.ET.207.01.1.1]